MEKGGLARATPGAGREASRFPAPSNWRRSRTSEAGKPDLDRVRPRRG
jgi:hypothetical protein